MTTHTYRTSLSWAGGTSSYEAYDRAHAVRLGPVDLQVSADPAFRGDPALPNPEQLLLAAASSCQLLSFLAVAARARVEVLRYEDTAEAVMPEDDRPVRITRIVLRPHVVVRSATPERVLRLMEVAHRECFIANSLTSEIVVESTVEVTPG